MINLLRYNMMRLKKYGAFKISVITVAAVGLITVFLEKRQEDCYTHPYAHTYFSMVFMLILIISFLAGNFISKDYVDNTIRNKISIGHKRLDIFIANHITVFFMYILIALTWTTFYLLVGGFVLDTSEVNKDALLVGGAVMFFAILAFSGVAVFLSMTFKNTLGGMLPAGFFYATLFIDAFNELIDSKLLDFLTDFLPNLQIVSLNTDKCDDKPVLHIVFSILIFIASFIGGYSIFRKTDLN